MTSPWRAFPQPIEKRGGEILAWRLNGKTYRGLSSRVREAKMSMIWPRVVIALVLYYLAVYWVLSL